MYKAHHWALYHMWFQNKSDLYIYYIYICPYPGYCKSLIFHGYYILWFFSWTLVHWFLFCRFWVATLLQCTAKTFAWYLISQKQFIHKINPTQNLRLLHYEYTSRALLRQTLTLSWLYGQKLCKIHSKTTFNTNSWWAIIYTVYPLYLASIIFSVFMP